MRGDRETDEEQERRAAEQGAERRRLQEGKAAAGPEEGVQHGLTFVRHSIRKVHHWRKKKGGASIVRVALGSGGAAESPEDAAEEAKGAAEVGGVEAEAAEQQAEVVAVGLPHGAGRVSGGGHGFFNQAGEEVEILGRGGGGDRAEFRLRFGGGFRRGKGAGGEFVEADGDGLAEVHGGLAGVGGDGDENVAVREVFAGEAVLFRTEDKDDAAAAVEFARHKRGQVGEGDDRLLGLAVGKRAGADYQGGCGHGLGKSGGFNGVGEQPGCANGRTGFAPMGRPGGDDGEAREAEVGHGAGHRPDVEGVARGDEDDVETVLGAGLGWKGQRMIVEPEGGERAPGAAFMTLDSCWSRAAGW